MRLTSLFRVPAARRGKRQSPLRLRVEPLEARWVPAGFSTFLGGTDADAGGHPVVDGASNTYVIGHTDSADFPVTFGTFHGQHDIYLVKLGPDGGLLWATLYGGSEGDFTNPDPVVDAAGDLYLTGTTYSTDFPTTPGAYQEAPTGTGTLSFVMKVEGATGAILYSTYLTANAEIDTAGIAVDAAGNAYLTGHTGATDFPTTPGAFQPTFGGGPGYSSDAFVLKLDPSGSSLVYATYLGGGESDYGGDIAVDAAGNAYVTGTTWDSFPTTAGAYDTTANGPFEAFVAKLDPTGGSLVYSTYLGGGGSDYGDCIAVDAAGNAFVAGWTSSTDFPVTGGAFDSTHNGSAGSGDAYVAKLDPTGSSLNYATYLGGNKSEGAYDLAVDGAGNVYLTGHTESTNFPTTPDAVAVTLAGPSDAFVAKLNPAGSALVYSTYLGGNNDEYPLGIATDRGGNVYVSGNTLSADFPTSDGAYQGTYGGGFRDAFVTKLAIGSDIGPAVTIDRATGQTDPTNASPISFDVIFDAPVTGFDGSDIDFTGSTVSGTLAGVVIGTGSAYTVRVTGMIGTGTVVASIPAGAAAGSGLPTQASTSTDNVVTFDGVAPTVAVVRAAGQAALTNASPVRFLVTFSEPVAGFDAADVTLLGTATGAAVAAVDPGPVDNSYLVTVDVPGAQAGTVVATVPAGRVADPVGNPNPASTGDGTVAFDNVPPTVAITSATGGPVGGPAVSFDVVFSEPVVGFDESKVNWSAPAGAAIEVTGDGPAYTVTVSGMTAGGLVAVRVDAGAVADAAGNPNDDSNEASVTYVRSGTIKFSAATYDVDETGAPTLTVTVTRTGGAEGVLDVNYATANGTALAGIDYLASSGTLHFADGDTTDQTFSVKVLDDEGFESDSAFSVYLSGISLPGALGTPAAATVNIREQAALAFTAPRFDIAEDDVGHADVTATVTVSRQFGSHGDVTVHYTITGGTATAGSDYTVPLAAGDLTWLDGITADQPITFTIKDEALNEGKETVFLTLTLPATPQNALLGTQTTTTLVIGHSDGTKVEATAKSPKATFTDADGDGVTVTLGGKVGTMTIYRQNGAGDITEIALAGTDRARSKVTVAVKKPRGVTTDGRVQLGEVTGTGAKKLGLGKADLVGTGLAGDGISLTSFLGSLIIGDVRNGADITLGGAPPLKPANAGTRITAGRIQGTATDPTDILFADPKGRLAGLTAVSVGEGSITAASAGAITAKGKPKTKTSARIPGDFNSDLAIGGAGAGLLKGVALGSLNVAGAVTGATIRVNGNVGRVTVGSFIDSRLFARYAGDEVAGIFDPVVATVGPFVVKAKTDGFVRSFVFASSFKRVTLASATTDNADNPFGFVYKTSFAGLTLTTPTGKKTFNKTLGGTQIIEDDLQVKKAT